MKHALILSALSIFALASSPAMAEDVQLRMGGKSNLTIETAPGAPVNMEKAPSGFDLQIIEIKPSASSFEEAKTNLQAAVDAFLAKVKTADGQAVIDNVVNKHSAFTALEAEFMALSVKDTAAIEAYTTKLFDGFNALQEALQSAVQFDTEASKEMAKARNSFGIQDLMVKANQDAIRTIVLPVQSVAEARAGKLKEGMIVVQSTYIDSLPLFQELVAGGEPNEPATSQKTLKLYFGKMVEEWSK